MARLSLDDAPVRAALGTAAGYGVILFAMFVLLFVIPYVLFAAL